MGKYVSSENGTQAMTCNRTAAQGWEQFDWVVNADSTISLRGNNGLYVSSENGTQAMNCNRTTIQGWEKFKFGVVVGRYIAQLKIVAAAHPVSLLNIRQWKWFVVISIRHDGWQGVRLNGCSPVSCEMVL